MSRVPLRAEVMLLTVPEMEEVNAPFGLNPKGGAINKAGKVQCIVLNVNVRQVEKVNAEFESEEVNADEDAGRAVSLAGLKPASSKTP